MTIRMKAKQSMGSKPVKKTIKGRVNINEIQGGLYYNFPTAWFDGKQVRKSAQLPSTPEGWAKAESVARQMELDWLAGSFDPSLEKYKLKSTANLIALPSKQKQEPTLLEIWEKYLDHKRTLIAETTFIKRYQRVYTNAIKKAVDAGCKSAQEVRNHVVGNLCNENAVKLLSALSEAYTLALKNKLVTENAYLGLADDLRQSKAAKAKKKSESSEDKDWSKGENEDIRAFELEEVRAIIEYFESTPRIAHWSNYVKFLFLTGCRPGEAAALRWGHIIGDCERIVFDQSYDERTGITKSTKTYVTRFFPCLPALRELLKSLKNDPVDQNDLVFKSKTGKQVDGNTFYHLWAGNAGYKGVMPTLIEQGKIRQYLKPYATRHTFITHQVRIGIRPDVIATWVGNSVDVIFKHYYQPDKDTLPGDVLLTPVSTYTVSLRAL